MQLLCERARRYEEQIDPYLKQIMSRDIGKKDMATVALLDAGKTAFGRMSRVIERILGMLGEIAGAQDRLTEADRRDAIINGRAIEEVLQLTIRGYNARAANVARTIRCYTEEVTAIGGIVKRRYLQRVHEEGRQQSDSTLFTDICYAQWQMIDYCDMIAEALIRYEKSRGGNPQTGSGNDEQLRKQVHEIFRDKYEALKEG